MRPEQRINGHNLQTLLADITRNPGNYRLRHNTRHGDYLETCTGLAVAWRGQTVATCSPSQYRDLQTHQKASNDTLFEALQTRYITVPGTQNQVSLLDNLCVQSRRERADFTQPMPAAHPHHQPPVPHAPPAVLPPAAAPQQLAPTNRAPVQQPVPHAPPAASAPPVIPQQPVPVPVNSASTQRQQETVGQPAPVTNDNDQPPQRITRCKKRKTKTKRASKTAHSRRDYHWQQWRDFYLGYGACLPGCPWSLAEILDMNEQELEHYHIFIQPQFPNWHVSPHNPKAPTLSVEMISCIHNSPEIQHNMLLSLQLMLNHWGITYTDNQFALNPAKWDQYCRWLPRPGGSDNDHNQRRITRTISCLYECGFTDIAIKLCLFLQHQRQQNGLPSNPYWYQAIHAANDVMPPRVQPTPPSTPAPAPAPAPQPPPAVRHHQPPAAAEAPPAPIKLPDHPGFQPGVTEVSYRVPIQLDNGNDGEAVVTNGNYGEMARRAGPQGVARFYNATSHPCNYYLTNTYVHRPRGINGGADYIQIGNHQYRSVEHYFQCMKFERCAVPGADPQLCQEAQQRIRNAPTGRGAKDISRDRRYQNLVDFQRWNRMRDQVMYEGIREKFRQFHNLRQQLLNTGHKILIETTAGDQYWANGDDDKGHNMTGQILGRVREELRRQP